MCDRHFTEHRDEKGEVVLLKKTHQGVIDRFEGEYAVVLVGPEQDEKIDIPRSLLPEEAEEGSLVSLSISVKKNKTAQAKKEVADMIAKLSSTDRSWKK